MKCDHKNIVNRIATNTQVWFLCNNCGSHVARIKGQLEAVDVIHKGSNNYELKVKESKEIVPEANELVEEEIKPTPVTIVSEEQPATEIDEA